MSSLEEIINICESVEYDGKTPGKTRELIEANGDAHDAKIVATIVGARGTNLNKIVNSSKHKDEAQKLITLAKRLINKYGVSAAHIASCFPEVVYDVRKMMGLKFSVNSLQFLKSNGLTKEQWLKANYEFLDIVGLSHESFDKLKDVIWNDDSLLKYVGERMPLVD
ncbi:nucleocapsid [Leishmania martiniquensis leishbunyavirus 1]|uniref:Nucleocapsid n=1 Tax=Leishmania martiniquensis leishbunyavirus 1 TaxID=2696682 RepID=A0A7U3MEY4_9VIRU|nr:nucleocapsid [Leishmania martiniquensis leishbunyavirus 1]